MSSKGPAQVSHISISSGNSSTGDSNGKKELVQEKIARLISEIKGTTSKSKKKVSYVSETTSSEEFISESDDSSHDEQSLTSDDDDSYLWEKIINCGESASKNFLHFPRIVSQNLLLENKKFIELIDSESGKSYDAEIHSAKRNRAKKFIGNGWYEYARHKKLCKGYKLGFTIYPGGNRMYVALLNH